MKAIVCDRCGKLCTEFGMPRLRQLDEITKEGNWMPITRRIDLCPDCYEKFNAFMNAPKMSGIKEA